jgi:hypothetical protein
LLALSESTIRQRIAEDLQDGQIAYELDHAKVTIQRDPWNLLKKEKWWILAILMSLGVSLWTLADVKEMFSWTAAGITSTLILTVFIHSSHQTRFLLFFWLFIVLCLVPFVITFPIFQRRRAYGTTYFDAYSY